MRDLLTRSLPDDVRERIGSSAAAMLHGVAARSAGTIMEARAGQIEVRTNDDGTFHVSGYATTWDTPYEVAGGAPFGWTESIARGAADDALAARNDVRFLINHEGMPLARTKSGTMTLRADDMGLFVDVPSLDLSNPTAQELRSALLRGDVDQMSFAFTVEGQTWNKDYTVRNITKLKGLYDVSAVTYPANPATVIGARDEAPEAEQRTEPEARDAELDRFTPRQVAQYKADESLTETFGKYSQDSGPDGAHFMPMSPFAAEGLMCANCAFYDGARACEIVDGDIAPEALCKRWIIPADLIGTAAPQARDGRLPLSLAKAIADSIR